ncbi:hypothetical protein AM593_07051, partial [Mytilus galloprovincialis]
MPVPSHGNGQLYYTFSRRHWNNMNRLSINDCESRSLEKTKTATYECTPNEDLLNASINKEVTTGNACNVFMKLLKNDVGEKKVKDWEGQNNCDIEIRCDSAKVTTY